MADLDPVFIDGPSGRLFVMHYRPARATATCVLVLPAFAEEMNKSRRQLALQARALAHAGVATLIPDLTGTGDSDGRTVDMAVETWIEDLQQVLRFAEGRGYGDVALLAVRAGALLAAPLLGRTDGFEPRVVLWQPVTSGSLWLNQFLRLKLAAGLLGATDGVSVRDLRAALGGGESVEVAGYTLSASFASGIDALQLEQLAGFNLRRVDWFALGRAQEPLPPVARRVIGALEDSGCEVNSVTLAGDPFWATSEIVTIPELIDATCAVCT